MLTQLVVQNLVILQQAVLNPGEGLTVISGETGAGKSLLLDALQLLIGGRGNTKVIGPHDASMTVTGVFQITAALAARLEALTGVAPADSQYILRRRINKNGRSQCWINDVPVTANALQQATGQLVDIYAQHEAIRLCDVDRQLELLDAYGGHAELAIAYVDTHREVLERERELHALESGERDSLKELDYLRYQEQELADLSPTPGGLVQIEQRCSVLEAAETWRHRAEQALDVLGDAERGILRQLQKLVKTSAEAPDEQLRNGGETCEQALELLRDAERSFQQAADAIRPDPQALTELESQRDRWYDLMRKHGDSEAAILTAWDTIKQRIAVIEGLDQRRDAVANCVRTAKQRRDDLGKQLAEARRQAFKRLTKAVSGELTELGLPKVRLQLLEHELEQAGPTGTWAQEFGVAMNPGLPMERLGAAVSGGEAARLSLAFAIALAEQDERSILIFDEVDSGVGGRLGTAIGAKLRELGAHRSVIAITHTPQVAAAAHKHYVVRKHQHRDRTDVEVNEVAGAERISELTDMLGGGDAARDQAKALIGSLS